MSVEKVRTHLAAFGAAERIREFSVSSATVELAAAALCCEARRIAKTLAFMLDGQAIVVVCAGDAKIDNAKYKAQFSAKATMLRPDETLALTGFAVGGVCPFALPKGIKVYLDRSLKRFATVFPASGSSQSAIELSLEELERMTPFSAWIDVCKGWENTADPESQP